jgi:hypothetical protein
VSELFKGVDPNDLGEDTGFTEVAPFDHNIATCGKAYANTFQSGDVQISWQFTIKESIPQNVGKQVTLKFPAAPPTSKWEGGGQVARTDEEKDVARKEWARGMQRIMHVLNLPAPTDEQLSNEILATGWASQAEGVEVVCSSYSDKNKYGAVSALAASTEKSRAHVSISRLDDPAKDRKGNIPGETRGEQARKKIAEARTKL